MEGATLTIAFKDESTPGGAGSAASPLPSSNNTSDQQLLDQLKAITAAGGIGAFTARNQSTTTNSASQSVPVSSTVVETPITQPLPSPAVTTAAMPTGDAALAASIQAIQAADPNATAKEIAALLGGGIGVKQVQTYIDQSQQQQQAPTSTPVVTPSVPTPVSPTVQAPNVVTPPPIPPPVQQPQPPPVPPPLPSGPTPPPIASQQPPPPPTSADQVAQGVQNTVNSIAHFAYGFGPIGSAVAGVATSTANMPGVAGALAGAAPALIAAAPYVVAASAAIAVPAAAAYVVESIAQTARGQISGLSGEVAAAEANASIRRLISNIRTSDRLGDEVADYVENRSRLSSAYQETRDIFAEQPLDALNKLQSIFAKILEAGNSSGLNEVIANATFGPGISLLLDKLDKLLGALPPSQTSVGFLNIIPETVQLPPPFAQPTTGYSPRTPGSKPWSAPDRMGGVSFAGMAGP